MKKRFLLILVLASILLVAACAPPAPKLTLPEGAIKLSDVVPQMGEHWADPSTLPLGPIYLVHDEEVIGIEYMYTEDMMTEVSIPTPAGPEEFKDLGPLPVGVTVDHVTVSFMTHGHEGFEVPHWDIHMYFISPEERQELVPHEH